MGPALELKQMRYVVCLAEEGNVTRAAHRLNIVQPALSMQIAKVERHLGQSLFERGSRGVRLTAAGERFIALVTPILRDAEAMVQEMCGASGKIVGHVTIGLIASVARCTMARSAARVAERYPDVRLTVMEGYSESLLDDVLSSQIELALVNETRARTAVTSIPILEEDMMLICRRGRPGLPEPRSLPNLGSLPMALPSKRHGLRRILDDAAARCEIELIPRLEMDSIGALVDAVAAADLVTILPLVAVQKDIEAGTVDAYRLGGARLVRSIVAVHHPRRPVSPAACAVLDIIKTDLVEAARTARRQRR